MYLAGYALEEGESLGELQGRFPDSGLADALVYTPFPVVSSTETGTDVSVEIEKFPALFAADVDPDLAAVLAVSQRPLAARAFSEAAPVAAWKTKPSWGLVASSDRTINPDVERYGYERAGDDHRRGRLLPSGHARPAQGSGGADPGRGQVHRPLTRSFKIERLVDNVRALVASDRPRGPLGGRSEEIHP